MKKIAIRCAVIGFWVGLIFCGLYFPNLEFTKGSEQSINVFAWGDILDPHLISAFEKETGIKVHLNFYSTNEELIMKLKATHGVGYDLIIPSDYAIGLLRQDRLLKELDQQKLHFIHTLNPRLLGHSFDPDNRYSLPFEWEVFSIGFVKDAFPTIDPSWDLLFSKPNYKICMVNDPIEAIQFASFFLYGNIEALDSEQVLQVKTLLKTQKSWVEAYAESRADYFLATRSCPIVLSSSSYLARTMQKFSFIGSVIPKEGTFITIENVAIPNASEKEDLVYQFLNFLYRPEIVASHYNTFGFFPATTNALGLINIDPTIKSLMSSSDGSFEKLHFIKALLPEQEMRDLWVEVKSRS